MFITTYGRCSTLYATTTKREKLFNVSQFENQRNSFLCAKVFKTIEEILNNLCKSF